MRISIFLFFLNKSFSQYEMDGPTVTEMDRGKFFISIGSWCIFLNIFFSEIIEVMPIFFFGEGFSFDYEKALNQMN